MALHSRPQLNRPSTAEGGSVFAVAVHEPSPQPFLGPTYNFVLMGGARPGILLRSVSVTSVLVALACAAVSQAAQPAQRWWAHVQFLADDALEGRDTGSPGHRKAAEYVATHLKTSGLQPGGTDGYLQPIAFESRQFVEERSRLAIARDDKEDAIVLGDAAVVSVRVRPAPQIDAPLAFAGYGLSVPEAGYDDLEGVDLKGRVAVVLSGGPATLSGPVIARASSARWAALQRAGAVGVATILRTSDVPWDRIKLRRLAPVKALRGEPDDSTGQQISLTVNPAAAEQWFAGSGHTAADMLALAAERKPLVRFPLNGRLRGNLVTSVSPLESDNVIGILPGSDPHLAGEYLVLSAHLDHLGRGEPVNGDSIYNGAMDNASGTATLLEVARRLHESGVHLRRSVVFLSVTAEEHGLLGSRYFAAHPTVPASAIVADLNTDMFLPLFPMRSLIVNGLEESDLADDLRRVGRAAGIEIVGDPEPERNAFVRSDQYSFIRRGIPALAFKIGWTLGSPEHEIVKRWRTERYHAPSDDVNQPVDLQAAEDFTRFYTALVEVITNRDTRPRWNETSYFKRFATQ
jgi:Zn-dependent M28 family amino/carboxypeptidase